MEERTFKIISGTISSISRSKSTYSTATEQNVEREHIKIYVSPGKLAFSDPFLYTAWDNTSAFGILQEFVKLDETISGLELQKRFKDEKFKDAAAAVVDMVGSDDITHLFTTGATSKNVADHLLGFAFSNEPICLEEPTKEYYVYDKNGKLMVNKNGMAVKNTTQRVCTLVEWSEFDECWAPLGARTIEDAIRAEIVRSLGSGRFRPVQAVQAFALEVDKEDDQDEQDDNNEKKDDKSAVE